MTGRSFGSIISSFLFPPKLCNHLAETKQSGESTCLTLKCYWTSLSIVLLYLIMQIKLYPCMRLLLCLSMLWFIIIFCPSWLLDTQMANFFLDLIFSLRPSLKSGDDKVFRVWWWIIFLPFTVQMMRTQTTKFERKAVFQVY